MKQGARRQEQGDRSKGQENKVKYQNNSSHKMLSVYHSGTPKARRGEILAEIQR